MRRKQLSPNPMPLWLADVNENSHFDRQAVLANSIYYPGCGFDGSPIEAYGGFSHSFVYVDYYCDKETVLKKISKFGGYEPVFIREIENNELSEYTRPTIHPKVTDFYGAHPEDSISELINRNKSNTNSRQAPFSFWAVMKRRSKTNPSHDPDRFSLLYVFGEGVATYHSLYNSNKIYPTAIIIAGADIGFGRNWTLFEQQDGIFERVVMENPAGIPKYLFTWNRYDPKCTDMEGESQAIKMYWKKYTKRIPDRKFLSIWTTEFKYDISLD
jgi:hypothetical protein